ncbi:MAG: GatB/YqeY domain-containing protein [Chitinophagaceae bacterium]|mgnify:CR=1 FL=1|nr:GatB/YqeY domain-containing protein [Chitinophagaceae bacterium]
MSLEQKVADGIKKAMLARDEKTLRSLRAIKSEILKEKTSPGHADSISEANEVKMLQRLIKQRRDSIEIYEQQNRDDLATHEKEEVEVIESFLPKQMSEDEVRKVISELIESLGASSMADMGKVMGAATKQLAGKAESRTIASAVKEILASK